MRKLSILALIVAASPAAAAGGYGTFSFFNTDFVVFIGFLLFLAVLFWFGVPGLLGKMLDDRSEKIQSDLNEARSLREEAQAILADYERKARDVQVQADKIVESAKADAAAAAEQAKEDLKASIARRLQAAEDQISNAEDKAVRQVRDSAVEVAIAAAADVLGGQTDAKRANSLIDDAIAQVSAQMN